MKYLPVEKIYLIDKLATEKYCIPSCILMENAGRNVAEFVVKLLKRFNRKKVIIFCGPGKNGGDGFVCARYLFIKGFNVKVIKFIPEENYKGDSLINLKILTKLKVSIEDYSSDINLNHYTVVVDAIFGIGLTRPIEGVYKEAIEKINSVNNPVVAIDIPSGINADTGEILGSAVEADYTLTMGYYKLAFRNKVVQKHCGKIILVDIGYPKMDIEN